MWLCIGGLAIQISAYDAFTRDLLIERWPEFLSETGTNADLTLSVEADFSLAKAFDPNRPSDLSVTEVGGVWHFQRVDFQGTWNPRTGEARVKYAGELPFISSFLRVLTAAYLSRSSGALIHSSTVNTGRGVILFPGPSGTGKSTVAGLAGDGRVLSDEVSALRIAGDRIFAMPTPFWGDLPRTRASGGGPLRAIVMIERGAPRCIQASKAEALAMLMHCAFAFDGGAVDKEGLLTTMRSLVERVPLFTLRYNAPESPWPLLESTIPPVSPTHELLASDPLHTAL